MENHPVLTPIKDIWPLNIDRIIAYRCVQWGGRLRIRVDHRYHLPSVTINRPQIMEGICHGWMFPVNYSSVEVPHV